MVRSKQLKKTVTSSTGVEVGTIYCRKCMQNLKPSEFFSAVDTLLDSNGFMSVCKKCCNDMYDAYYAIEHDIPRALLSTCRALNIKFDEASVESAMNQLKTYADKGSELKGILGVYKGKLIANSKNNMIDKTTGMDLTFHEPSIVLPPAHPLDDSKTSFDLKQYWGDNYDFDDYQFLEREMAEWKSAHKCDTKGEETLLKEICHKTLQLRKERMKPSGGSTSGLVKELQELMKTASVDPAKTSVAGSGKSLDTFSSFIKTIEQTEPADYFEDKKLFKDIDNIDWYFKKYVTRPLKNFITNSRDFNVSEDNSDGEELFDFDDSKDGEDGNVPPSL